MDLDQTRKKSGPDLDPNCSTLWLMVYHIPEIMLGLEKNQQTTKSPCVQTVKSQ